LKNQLKLVLAAGLVAAAPMVHAQAASAPVAAPSAAKQALINELLALQKPGIEAMARSLVQQPLPRLVQGASQALQNVPADKRDAVKASIEAEIKQFVQTNGDMLAAQADKDQAGAIGPLLNERLSEDDLRQIVAFLKSPASKKFAEIGGDMQKAMVQKLMADNGPTLDSRFKTLELDVVKQLGIKPPAAAPASAPAKAPAKK